MPSGRIDPEPPRPPLPPEDEELRTGSSSWRAGARLAADALAMEAGPGGQPSPDPDGRRVRKRPAPSAGSTGSR